jgi:hypothetical protein
MSKVNRKVHDSGFETKTGFEFVKAVNRVFAKYKKAEIRRRAAERKASLERDELRIRHHELIRKERKPAVLNELKTGAKHDFYVDCLKNDRFFIIETDGKKYEIRPRFYHYLDGGGYAMFQGLDGLFCSPTIYEDEILEIIRT